MNMTPSFVVTFEAWPNRWTLSTGNHSASWGPAVVLGEEAGCEGAASCAMQGMEQQGAAAVVVQAAFRGHLSAQKYEQTVKAVVTMQAFGRGLVQQARYAHAMSAVVRIQSAMRVANLRESQTSGGR